MPRITIHVDNGPEKSIVCIGAVVGTGNDRGTKDRCVKKGKNKTKIDAVYLGICIKGLKLDRKVIGRLADLRNVAKL